MAGVRFEHRRLQRTSAGSTCGKQTLTLPLPRAPFMLSLWQADGKARAAGLPQRLTTVITRLSYRTAGSCEGTSDTRAGLRPRACRPRSRLTRGLPVLAAAMPS